MSSERIKSEEEAEEQVVGRKLSTIVTASMAVRKLQNDTKKIQQFKETIKVMRHDSSIISLHSASEQGDYDNVQKLLKKECDPNSRNELSKTPLHLACKGLSPNIISLLIDNGADVNAQDTARMSPLHHVLLTAKKNNVEKVTECLHLLIKNKANVNLSDQMGYTALHLAAVRAEEAWVNVLISAGADLGSKNNEGIAVLYFVMKNCPNSILKCIDSCAEINDRKDISPHGVEFDIRMDFNTLDLRSNDSKFERSMSQKVEQRLGKFRNTRDPTVFFNQILSIRGNGDPRLNNLCDQIFMHPISQTYFYIKWSEIKWLYYVIVLLAHFLYSVAYSTYAVLIYRTICKTETHDGEDEHHAIPFHIDPIIECRHGLTISCSWVGHE